MNSILLMVLAAVIVLGPLIAIHEFGHYWVARRVGVKVLTFSIGFGPALLQKTAILLYAPRANGRLNGPARATFPCREQTAVICGRA